jgi:transposase
MPKKKYLIDLSADAREPLHPLIRRGTTPTRTLTRARMLLKAADGGPDTQIVAALDVGIATVERIRKRCVEAGVPALPARPRRGKPPQLDPKAHARLIAAACSKAPDGRKRWPLQWLAARVVALHLADACS